MAFLLSVLFMSAEESDPFADLKAIADKIIPDDPWAIIIQLVSTFILVFILAKFLVKPARKFIAARQEYIQTNLEEASSKNQESDIKLAEANKQIKEAKTVSKELIENAKVTALNEKDRIVEETKAEVDSMKAKARKDIENERKKMKEELTSEVIDVALLAASKVVEREVNKEDNQAIIESFIKDEE